MAEEHNPFVENTVRGIHRKTHKKYSVEEKVRIVLEGLRGKTRSRNCAVVKASTRTCITPGRTLIRIIEVGITRFTNHPGEHSVALFI
jgi:hypothetical protein